MFCSWFSHCPRGSNPWDKVRWTAPLLRLSSSTGFLLLHQHHIAFQAGQMHAGKIQECHDHAASQCMMPHLGRFSSGGWTSGPALCSTWRVEPSYSCLPMNAFVGISWQTIRSTVSVYLERIQHKAQGSWTHLSIIIILTVNKLWNKSFQSS